MSEPVLAKHPLRGDGKLHRKTYEVVCKRVEKFYGVPDAERFYQARRRAILDKCLPDEFGWGKYESLKEWHEALVLAARHGVRPGWQPTEAPLPEQPEKPINMNIYAISFLLIKYDEGQYTSSQSLHIRAADSEDEAKGRAMAAALKAKPGFAIQDVCCTAVSGNSRDYSD